MPREIERFIRIQEPAQDSWRTLPNCDKVPVWETGKAQRVEEDGADPITLHIFHIPHIPRVARGHRVLYLGQNFEVTEVSNTSQLLGLELRCRAEG